MSDTNDRAAAAPAPEGLDVVHRILHEFTGRACPGEGAWCDARDHAEAVVAALRVRPALSDETLREMAFQFAPAFLPTGTLVDDLIAFARAVLARQAGG
jgi:hypothetical protein